MFERFTEPARQVVVLAQDEARALGHDYIGTAHILLGLFRVEEGLAARVLESLGLRLEEVRAQVVRVVGEGTEGRTAGQIPFTKYAKRLLELALREALSLGHDSIGTHHILLATVRENEGDGWRILFDFGADAEKVRDGVIKALEGSFRRQADEGLPPGEESKIELTLLRVVPVARRMSDGTWVVSLEVWGHGLTLRWATSERPAPTPSGGMYGEWHISDDANTDYTQVGRRRLRERGFHGEVSFEPAPPSTATTLDIRHEDAHDVVSVSLTD